MFWSPSHADNMREEEKSIQRMFIDLCSGAQYPLLAVQLTGKKESRKGDWRKSKTDLHS